jgi:competence protein ComEA
MNLFNLRHVLTTLALALSLTHAPAFAQGSDAPATAELSASPVQGVLNLNTATEEELMRLPSVGPSKAKAILELRAQLKGFKKVDDLMRVKGIGRKTFRKLMQHLKLEGATTLVEVARSSARPAAAKAAKPAK